MDNRTSSSLFSLLVPLFVLLGIFSTWGCVNQRSYVVEPEQVSQKNDTDWDITKKGTRKGHEAIR